MNHLRFPAWVDQEEERRRLTLEALADVDAGGVIDHQAVQAWADSLDSDTPLSDHARTLTSSREVCSGQTTGTATRMGASGELSALGTLNA